MHFLWVVWLDSITKSSGGTISKELRKAMHREVGLHEEVLYHDAVAGDPNVQVELDAWERLRQEADGVLTFTDQ